MDWHEIWERQGRVEVEHYDLQTLLMLDGFGSGAGKLGPEDYSSLADLAARELDLRPGMRLLDVGCGAGAMLWSLRDSGLELFGVDSSAALIGHARRALPQATFAVAEATELPFEADAIVCCSVFHYFPSLAYARRVLEEFERVAPVAAVLDVPDLELRELSERARTAAGSKPGTHLYYSRSFFKGARILGHEIVDYGNGPYRFHALVEFRPGKVRTRRSASARSAPRSP